MTNIFAPFRALSLTQRIAVIVAVVMAGLYLMMGPNVTPTQNNPLLDLRPLHNLIIQF
jgi:disulfide bond formation protein DsbB